MFEKVSPNMDTLVHEEEVVAADRVLVPVRHELDVDELHGVFGNERARI